MNPIELFPREYAKGCVHLKRIAIVLASHDERTHGDVFRIVLFDILRSQIKVRVPVQRSAVITQYATAISGAKRTDGLLEIRGEGRYTSRP